MLLYKSMETAELKRHEARISVAITLSAIGMTTVFHFLFFCFPYGIAFVLFIASMIFCVHALAVLTGKRGNPWAYLFMAPLICAMVAEILYASDIVRGIGFLVTIVSLTLFTFWFTAPSVRFWENPSLWPVSLFIESFFPFQKFSTYAKKIIRNGNRLSKILIGIAIAIPFLFIISALFVSADAFIQKILSDFFRAENVQQIVGRTLWDVFAFVFFASAGATLVSRLSEGRHPLHKRTEHSADHVIASTFLVLLNILFVAFIGFQIVYFFGGTEMIQTRGIAYASYAREGFFQLLWVAIIVTGITAVIYRITGMRYWLIRVCSILLALQTGVVIASALRRMILYVDAYGLSVQRFWAMFTIYAIALILLTSIIAIITKVTYASLVKGLTVGTLLLVSASLLINAEGIVADVNVNRYLSGASKEIDANYLMHLSSDATPALVRLAKKRPDMRFINDLMIHDLKNYQKWADDPSLPQHIRDDAREQLARKKESLPTLRDTLRAYEQRMQDARASDWRNFVFSDYQALAALGELK